MGIPAIIRQAEKTGFERGEIAAYKKFEKIARQRIGLESETAEAVQDGRVLLPLMPLRSVAEANIKEYNQFLESATTPDQFGKLPAREFYRAFEKWCKQNGLQTTATASAFGRFMATKFQKRKSNGSIIYFGIKLKSEAARLVDSSLE